MKTLYRTIFFVASILIGVQAVVAQKEDNTSKVPVRMIIEPSASLSLAIGNDSSVHIKTNVTQQIVTPKTSNNTWLNYSSIVKENNTNTICASLSFSDLPANVIVKMKIGTDAAQGEGIMGTPADPIILSDYPQTIISNIGTCFTGQGVNKGHLLTYTWEELDDDRNSAQTKPNLNNYRIGVIFTFFTGD